MLLTISTYKQLVEVIIIKTKLCGYFIVPSFEMDIWTSMYLQEKCTYQNKSTWIVHNCNTKLK